MDKLISLQQAIDALRKMQTYKLFAGDDMLLIDQAGAQTELMMLPPIQPEPEAISKWKKEFREYVDSLDIARDDWKGIIEYIGELPSAQPERIKGHWIAITSWNNTYKCSVCGRLLVNITDGKNKVAKNYPYCHCGADMRGEQNDN